MLNRTIRKILCDACGFKGPIHDGDTENGPSPGESFVMLETDAEGLLHFLCPACDADLTVDPTTIGPGGKTIGHPPTSGAMDRALRSNPVVRWFSALALFSLSAATIFRVVKGQVGYSDLVTVAIWTIIVVQSLRSR